MSQLSPPLLTRMGLRVSLPPIVGIFLTVFLDLLAFGLFIPDLQLRGRELGAVGINLGLALGIFSLCQFVASPILGRISDYSGRRRVLLISTLLSTVSYVVYAHANALPMVILSRALSGVAAANLGVAFAYVADVTKPEDRSKGLGLIGAAFGLGFILGPVMGGLLLIKGAHTPVLLGYTGATLSFLNFLYVLFVLPESLTERTEEKREKLIENYKVAFANRELAVLLAMFFMLTFAFSNLESTFFQLLASSRSVFHLGNDQARVYGSYILGCVGAVSAFSQGFLIRKFAPKYGEVNILRVSYLICIPCLALIPFLPLWIPALIGVIVLGGSSGIAQPSLSSLTSMTAPKEIQGGVFGITQGLGALARLTAPLVANSLFEYVSPVAPYITGSIVMLLPAALAWRIKQPAPRVMPLEPAEGLTG